MSKITRIIDPSFRSGIGKYLLERISIDQDGCWIWQKALNSSGYGVFNIKKTNKTYRAHRVAYELAIGDVKDKIVDHVCHNEADCPGGICKHRSCINPMHLRVATQSENCKDGNSGLKTGARQRAKTHCINGHEYSESNTYHYRNERQCKICKIENKKRWRLSHV